MSVNLAGPSIEQNYGFLRTAYGMIPRRCQNILFPHNEHQDGSGSTVFSEMVYIPRFKFDRTLVIARGLAAAADIPAALDGVEFGGFYVDKYKCSQPNARPFCAYQDVVQNNSPGIHAARSQHGCTSWDFLDFSEANLACENRGGIEIGTAVSGTTTSLVLSGTPSTAIGYYYGWRVQITAGTNVGQARKVASYSGATKTLIFSPFSSAIDATSVYRLTQFHLLGPNEWAAIAYLSLMFGTQPHGNNNSGADIDFPNEKPIHSSSYSTSDLTGTGPATFAHNHDPSGVYDLNGMLNEWINLKIGGTTNYLISEVDNNNTHAAIGKAVPSSNGYFNKISSDTELMKLAIPGDVSGANLTFGQDSYTTRTGLYAAVRGGRYLNTTDAGIFYLSSYTESTAESYIGFRAALSL